MANQGYVLVLTVLLFPPYAAAQPEPPPSYQISVDVHLVVLNATVRDQGGGFAASLRERNFTVFEDGVPQSIRLFRPEDVPVTVGLVVDHSGSMGRKLGFVITAARTFVQSSKPEDEMFVVNFNEKVTFGLPSGIRLTNSPDELARAISNTPTTGKTALYDAIAGALTGLRDGSWEKKVLIVISDGGDNASRLSLDNLLQQATRSNALIYAIGIFDNADPDRNPNVLRRLARATGGDAFFPPTLSDVEPVCQRIARDIRHQYTLGYISSNPPKPGAFRSVRVSARAEGGKKLSVRTRSGYTAAAESPK